jgi:hypothetical protein
METQQIQLNDFQQRLLGVPEQYDLFLGGGRGGGKSYALALLALRHVEQYGEKARILYLRKTYKGLADFELVCRELFGTVYSTSARYNAAEHVWTFPNGAYMELGQLETGSDYTKYQGRSFTLLLVDEAGQYGDPSLLDMMRSNMRGSKLIPIRMVIAANPGGPGHAWLAKRYVFQNGPWCVFNEVKSKRRWVYAPSTFAGNALIDREQYADALIASCPDDEELLRAWTDGDWAISRGAYFASCLAEDRNAINVWEALPDVSEGWDFYLSHDFGSAAPSVTYLIAKSPGSSHDGKFYPRGSLILVDELAAVKKDNVNAGLGWTAAITAEAIKTELCNVWGIYPSGVADDACFARNGATAGSIADEFAQKGVYFQPARKADRISGWQRMKRLLSDAGGPDRPGLYISRRCEYFWATVPYLARDQKRAEDLDSSGADHAADACRYGLLAESLAYDVNVGW